MSKTFNVEWDETETVTTRYWDEAELDDDELAVIEAEPDENLRAAMLREAILERVRETSDYSCEKWLYAEVEDVELISIDGVEVAK